MGEPGEPSAIPIPAVGSSAGAMLRISPSPPRNISKLLPAGTGVAFAETVSQTDPKKERLQFCRTPQFLGLKLLINFFFF